MTGSKEGTKTKIKRVFYWVIKEILAVRLTYGTVPSRETKKGESLRRTQGRGEPGTVRGNMVLT